MKTIIYAHRGASKQAPENTLPAFELAYESGADGIETDIQLTKDGIPVLFHDENVRRTTNGTGFIQDYTFKELQRLDAGAWFSNNYINTSILSLEQFLSWISNKNLLLNLELKTNVIPYKHIEQIVYELLVKYDKLRHTVISSFNPNSLLKMHRMDPTLTTAFLTSNKKVDLINYTKQLGAKGIHIKNRLVNESLINKAKQENIYVATYTVNRPSQLMRCYKIRCHAIFTDLPYVAIETRELFEQNIIQ
ncbi:Glycerophosphoryl diester phosphodiesterase [Paraliobacillus sp. PM-2]|uniref:glycerophosphodiester phosphodiesterase family protein n=1 Tax=Paraliobacillus sp. PM-2 TaxID=1462524 RepID=UPI00061CBB2D|nr:glycerophosphodiester phosphodiesterase family protein [Paraliobacillus sp. PM-2]CQR46755.1 Glycerophosphoryl diester phosphodiesterase [Paraliobacillus sp. PM-2]